MKHLFLILITSVVAVWIIVAVILESVATERVDAYYKKERLERTYVALSNAWSGRNQRKALKRWEKVMAINGVTFTKVERKNEADFDIFLPKGAADKILNALFNTPVRILAFSLNKESANMLKAHIKVGL